MMRQPSETLVVDSNILLRAALSPRLPIAVTRVAPLRRLVTSERCVVESYGVVESHQLRPIAEPRLHLVLRSVAIVGRAAYAGTMDNAGLMLSQAAGDKNASRNDAHVLAVGWLYDADIWSHDRGFAGTGWPSWSSANLLAALTVEA